MKISERPEHPDGTKYEFNCCAYPDVHWEHSTVREVAECRNCGYDWTDQLDV